MVTIYRIEIRICNTQSTDKNKHKEYTVGSSKDREQQKYIIKKQALKAVRVTLLLLLFSC